MTDFSIDTVTTSPRIDTRWRTSKFGEDVARPGTLDLSKFVEGTHYNIGARKDNIIPSGVAVQLGAGGLYEPWDGTTGVLAGYINDDQGIELYRRAGVGKSTRSTFALLVVGIIDASYLPVVAQRTTVKAAANVSGKFVYA